MSGQLVHFFFQLRDQLKIYHWQTSSYARHKATDDLIKELDEHIDLFVEIWMGKYGRVKLTRTTQTIEVKNMSEKTAIKFVKDAIQYLQGPLTRSLKGTDTDLMNIRDEIIGDLNKVLYLFTLQG
jgi:hypothetical protein